MKLIKITKININKIRWNLLVLKTSILTFLMIWIVFCLTITRLDLNEFLWDILDSSGLLTKEVIIEKMDSIKDTSLVRPLKEVTNRGIVQDYEKIKRTKWEQLSQDFKIPFPQKIQNIIDKYKFVNVYDIYESIDNPLEREKLSFYKRLITTLWTAKYCTSKDDCTPWIEWIWTHAGVDFVTSIRSPINSISNWIIAKMCSENCDWFWISLVVITNFKWELIATFYWHLDWIKDWLKEWDIIKKWEHIWYVWNSWNSSAPHLHIQINRIWQANDIETISIAKEMYKIYETSENKIDLLKKYTYNPLSLIESNLWSTNDSFSQNDSIDNIEIVSSKTQNQENSENIDNANQEIIELTHNAPIEDKFIIESIWELNDWKKLYIWETSSLIIKTIWSNWNITINSTNDIIQPLTNELTYNWKNEYMIYFKNLKAWNWEIVMNDWANKKIVYFSIYDKSKWFNLISLNWPDTLYFSNNSTFNLNLVDKLWNFSANFEWWTIKVFLVNDDSTQTNVDNYEINSSIKTYSFDILPNSFENKKLKIIYELDWKTYIAIKNISVEIFNDFNLSSNYWNSIKVLYEKNILKWSNWKLMPNNDITRAELITILMRYKYPNITDNDYKNMENYIKKNWKIFKDINKNDWYAIYFYMWKKDNIVKWSDWYWFPNNIISNAELITLYWRFFWVYIDDRYSRWLDISNNDWYKVYADWAKKYWLFPFKNYFKFDSEKKVKRIDAFESLYRYINFDGWESINYTESIPVSNTLSDEFESQKSWSDRELIDLFNKFMN